MNNSQDLEKQKNRIPIVHKLRWTSQQVQKHITEAKEYPISIPRPLSIGEDVQKGDKLLITVKMSQDIIRTIDQVTETKLFLKR